MLALAAIANFFIAIPQNPKAPWHLDGAHHRPAQPGNSTYHITIL
jgi:hypothetical protein